MLKQSLAQERVVYVEYSNEVWNFIFPQTVENMNAAVAEAVAGDASLTDGTRCTQAMFNAGQEPCNKYWAGFRRVGKKTAQISRIFSEVFGAAALNNRVRVVYATQFANPAIAEQVLKNVARYRGKPASLFYAVAGAPYFGLDEELSRSPRLDADAIHASLQKSLDTGVLPFFAPGVMQKGAFQKGVPYRGGDGENPSLKALADYYGIKSFAYEGGPDLGQQNVSLPAKFAANVDERMGAKMEQVLQQWYGCGNGLYVHFTLTSAYGRYGFWGLTNDARDLQTAKYRAAAAAARRPAAEYRTCR